MTAQRCAFVPAHEPWTCSTHQGIRTSLNEPECDAIRPVKPLTAGQLDNLRRADAQGRVPHSRYIVRGLLASLALSDDRDREVELREALDGVTDVTEHFIRKYGLANTSGEKHAVRKAARNAALNVIALALDAGLRASGGTEG